MGKIDAPKWTEEAAKALIQRGLMGDRLLVDVDGEEAQMFLIAPRGRNEANALVAWARIHVSGRVLASSETEGGEI